jgi:single-stranded DNA-binding protein
MIEALISGKMQGQPSEKMATTGKPFVTAKVRVHAGDADVFVNVIAFSESACAALLALQSGDAVSLAGSLTPKAWTDREGVVRPALDLVASQVLTASCGAQAQGGRAYAARPGCFPTGQPGQTGQPAR